MEGAFSPWQNGSRIVHFLRKRASAGSIEIVRSQKAMKLLDSFP